MKPTITIKLDCGLGNRLFKLAFIHSLAKKHNLEYEIINTDVEHQTHDYFDSIFSNFKSKLSRIENITHIYIEPSDSFAKYNTIATPIHNTLYVGYFQNEDYFRTARDNFVNLLLLGEGMATNSSYFIHVRQGDYVANYGESLQKLEMYYKNAIEAVRHIDPLAHFYIVSDDIEYCKTSVLFRDINADYYENSDEVETLAFLTKCAAGGICANSTFSWWGAYLNSNDKKLMLFPDRWVTEHDTNGVYPYNSVIMASNYEYLPSRLTIVSGFWNVKSKHSLESYIKWFENMTKIDCACIFFGDSESISLIRRVRGNLPIVYVKISLDDFYTAQYRDRMATDNTHAPSVELNMIWNEKVFLIQRAKQLNIYRSEFFMWVDAGISILRHNSPPVGKFPQRSLDDFPLHKFSFTSTETDFDATKIGDYYHYISGIFMLDIDFVDTYVDIYKKYAETYLPRDDKVYTDQIIHTLIYADNPQFFHKVGHGYGELLTFLYNSE